MVAEPGPLEVGARAAALEAELRRDLLLAIEYYELAIGYAREAGRGAPEDDRRAAARRVRAYRGRADALRAALLYGRGVGGRGPATAIALAAALAIAVAIARRVP